MLLARLCRSTNLCRISTLGRQSTLQSSRLLAPISQWQSDPDPGLVRNFCSGETKKGQSENIYTIPNALTGFRILATPVIGGLTCMGLHTPALWLFAVAGLTDCLDGWIARRWPGQSSNFGSFLDPLADKFLMTVVSASLVYADFLPVGVFGLIVLRDLLLILSGLALRLRTMPLPVTTRRFFTASIPCAQVEPTVLGKMNTWVQCCVIGGLMSTPVLGTLIDPVFLWSTSMVFTFISGFSYPLSAKQRACFMSKRLT